MAPMSILLIFVYLLFNLVTATDVDPNGYILYCPCMGRFGNQADHFLGSLAFAKALNRTLALPPWVEYKTGHLKSLQVPFDTYLKVEPLQEIHRVVTMGHFMEKLSSTVWPKGKRKVFCYSARGGGDGCNAKDGNPFGPFWDTFGVDFDESIFYQPLHYDVHFGDTTEQWMERYPPDIFPVLAFTGAPATFPVRKEDRHLHRHLVWSDSIKKAAKEFINSMKPRGPFVGIHLRNGQDWVRACEHIEHSPLLFSAPQCLGWRSEHGKATPELCMPSKETILRQLRSKVKALKARSVFVASDSDHMVKEIETHLKDLKAPTMKWCSTSLVLLVILSVIGCIGAQNQTTNSTEDVFDFSVIRETVGRVMGRVYQKTDRYDFAAQVLRALFEHLFAVFYYT